ncbi:hypothetical protein ABRZ24_05145 [Brenneria populi]|uniref:Uncharacterized protein n=1 Tax=Brenneria populi TaxID=1505588 RepID=A0ABU6JMU0_9GAMM|nr:hypothetical protein [Brenneria populi Li et al. 2015]
MLGFPRYAFIFMVSMAFSVAAYSAEVLRIGYQKSATTLVLLKGAGEQPQ